MADPKGIESLGAYVGSLASTTHSAFVAKSERKVAHEGAFEEMKAHILNLYEKVEAPHSFMDETGAIFDCVPVEQQPALRGTKESVPKAPDLPNTKLSGKDEKNDVLVPAHLGDDKKDHFGNVMKCPDGTIPMRRVTLEDLTRFPTLQDFFRKAPRKAGRPAREIEPATVPATHRWAHAYQSVN